MRRHHLPLAMALFMSMAAHAQTLNVNMGDVTYAYPAEQTGEMTYGGGTTLTIGSKTYTLADVSSITIDDSEVADNSVAIEYSGTSSKVRIAGHLAPFVTAQVRGAHVTIDASADLVSEVTYRLSGSSSDGSLYVTGSYKMGVTLSGLALSNPDSAAINIQNGKLTTVTLVDGTDNSLSDGLRGSDDGSDGHKAAFYVDGHTRWSGGGTLTIAGNVRHGFFSDEYTELLDGLGRLTVSSAVADGLHVNQYFRMQGGTVSITASGDGIDVGAKKTEKDLNGQLLIEGGTLTVAVSGDAVKGLKSDAAMTLSGGTTTVSTTGGVAYDDTENDLSSCAALKTKGTLTISGGTHWLQSTGSGGKGINADGAISVTGGSTTVVTTGASYAYDTTLDTKPHAVKCDTDITLSGGEILSCASSDSGVAFKTSYNVLTNGATVMGVGGKATSASTASTCSAKKYSGVSVKGGSMLSYDGVSFTIPSIYSNSSAKVLVSKK